MSSRSRMVFALVVALAFPALVALSDLGMNLFCSRAPLYVYVGALGAGVLGGFALGKKLAGSFRILIFRLAMALVGAGTAAGVWLTLRTPNWSSKCAHRHCDRALGLSIDRSPFPVGEPSCEGLHRCANEAAFSSEEMRELERLLRERRCAAR